MRKNLNIRPFCAILLMALSILLLGGSEPRTKTLFMPKKAILTPITPENTILAFDIHSVLVEKNSSLVGWNLFKNAGAVTYINHAEVKKHYKNLDLKTASPEDLFLPLAEKIPDFEKYIPGFLKVVNAQEIISGIKPILEKLAQKHFELDILSNIGEKAYYGWKSNRNKKLSAIGLKDIHPSVFKYFNHVQVASRKPNPQAYIGFTENYVQKRPGIKNIVFIDDKWENVQAAVNEGFIGIWFKSSFQLETELMRLGIL